MERRRDHNSQFFREMTKGLVEKSVKFFYAETPILTLNSFHVTHEIALGRVGKIAKKKKETDCYLGSVCPSAWKNKLPLDGFDEI